MLLLVGHSTGGIGAHVQSLATGLPAHGWTPVVATSPRTASRFDLGPDVHLVWPGRRGAVGRLRRLRSLVAGVDVVHAHGHQAGLLAVLLAATVRRRRPPVVVSWHNAVLGGGWQRRLRALGEVVQARRADLLAGASRDLTDRAVALGARAAVTAPVAAPAAGPWAGDRAAGRRELAREVAEEVAGEPAEEVAGEPADGPVVLTVSRIAPQKNLAVVVEAAARLRRRTGLRWLVVGDGDPALLAALRRQVVSTGAPVHFLGARRDVVRLMGLADVLALASSWEARALVVQEAMAAGLPVVVPAVGGLPELVGDAGVLVPPGDAGALADAVATLLDDDAARARLADAGRARFAELPDEAQVVAQWSDRYTRLLAW